MIISKERRYSSLILLVLLAVTVLAILWTPPGKTTVSISLTRAEPEITSDIIRLKELQYWVQELEAEIGQCHTDLEQAGNQQDDTKKFADTQKFIAAERGDELGKCQSDLFESNKKLEDFPPMSGFREHIAHGR